MYIMLYIFESSGTTDFVACSEDVTKLHRRAEQAVKLGAPRGDKIVWARGKRVGTVVTPRLGVVYGTYVIERTKPL